MNIFRRLRDWIATEVLDQLTPSANPRRIMAELNELADTASFAMARADDKFEQLSAATAQYEALDAEAATLLRAGDEAAARRCVAQRLEAEHTLKTLLQEYQTLQQAAEHSARLFSERQQAAGEKLNQACVRDDEIDSAMYELRLHVAEHPLVADVEGLEENPVAAAKKLLREPRYQDIFPENEV